MLDADVPDHGLVLGEDVDTRGQGPLLGPGGHRHLLHLLRGPLHVRGHALARAARARLRLRAARAQARTRQN